MSRSAWILLIASEVIALCCCGALIVFVGIRGFPEAQPTEIALIQPTATTTPTPRRTDTPAPTYTLVIQLRGTSAATRASAAPLVNLYNVVVPTPTAPKMIYPIQFVSAFALVTYTVSGKTISELSKSLEASALPDPHEAGTRYYANTKWYLSAHWSWKETPGGCGIGRSDVSIATTMTLPALATTNGVSADILNRWNSFIRNTQTHEEGHVRLAQQGARDYQRELGNFPPASDCTAIQFQLSKLFDREFAAIDQANVDYDTQTQHGLTQGAVFP